MNFNMVINDDCKAMMEERGINEEDVTAVISDVQAEKTHLYSENKEVFLAKKRLENFTVYVQFTNDGQAIQVQNVYSHRVSLNEDNR